MALSSNKSRRMAAANPVMTMEASMEVERPVVDSDDGIATLEADPLESEFTRSGNYTWFDTFSDNDYSTVDSGKEITLNPNQVTSLRKTTVKSFRLKCRVITMALT